MYQPLKKLRVLNTRPKRQALPLSLAIIEAGGTVVECPALDIVPNDTSWLRTLPKLTEVDTAIFISPNAVHYALSALKKQHIVWPDKIHTIAIGKGSVVALQKHLIRIDEIPAYPDSEHLIHLEGLKHLSGQTVLLFKGEGGREVIEQYLLRQGARVHISCVYQRKKPECNPEFIQSIWQDDQVDIILLTSERSIDNLFELFGEHAKKWLENKPCLVISERLMQIASAKGINNIVLSHPDQIVTTLIHYYQGLPHGQ